MASHIRHKVEEEVEMASWPVGKLATPKQNIVLQTLRHFELNHRS